MSRITHPIVFLLALAACSSSSTNDNVDRQHGRTGNLGYDVPAAWQHKDSNDRTSSTSVWTPTNNPAKESISVIRTEVHLAPSAGPAEIQQLLIQAQNGLRNAKVSSPSQIVSDAGLRGAQVSVDYLPPNMTQRYHRVHAVLLDGDSLVHIFYTAVDPDQSRQAFVRVHVSESGSPRRINGSTGIDRRSRS
ncbi:MAG: hypothetical protein H0T79_12200 [Deltaproteobacteria bacterium]|nr:hypothetical protein [Deltaproteobacteria bacterium]